MKVLVTGAAGYVGSHTCKALPAAGLQPIGLDNFERAGHSRLPWGPLEMNDTRDRSALDDVLSRHRPDAAIHFAAHAYVSESVTRPGSDHRNSALGKLTLLEALRDAGIDRLVSSSTCAIYGIPERVPIAEDHPQHPINPYGASNLMVERMLADFEHAYGLRHVSLRYLKAAGADPEGENRGAPRPRDARHPARNPGGARASRLHPVPPPPNLSVTRDDFLKKRGFSEHTPLYYTSEERLRQAELRWAGEELCFEPRAVPHHHDRAGFCNLLRRNCRWDYAAIVNRSQSGSMRTALLYRYPILLIEAAPLLAFARTLYILDCWIQAGRFEPVFMSPVILLSRFAYTMGMAVGEMQWVRYRCASSVGERPRPRWRQH